MPGPFSALIADGTIPPTGFRWRVVTPPSGSDWFFRRCILLVSKGVTYLALLSTALAKGLGPCYWSLDVTFSFQPVQYQGISLQIPR